MARKKKKKKKEQEYPNLFNTCYYSAYNKEDLKIQREKERTDRSNKNLSNISLIKRQIKMPTSLGI